MPVTVVISTNPNPICLLFYVNLQKLYTQADSFHGYKARIAAQYSKAALTVENKSDTKGLDIKKFPLNKVCCRALLCRLTLLSWHLSTLLSWPRSDYADSALPFLDFDDV